jgi:hypothetical protein
MAAFQHEQQQQLRGVVEQLCARLRAAEAPAAVRCGAAAALGVLPAQLVAAGQEDGVVAALVAAVQVGLPRLGRVVTHT